MFKPDDRMAEIERLLRTTLPGRLTPASDACLEPEALAAWAEGGLPTTEAAEIELHLADCARCQAMLAVFARSEPPAAAAAPLWQRWTVRWLVPLAAGAAAVTVWMVLPRNQQTPAPAQTMARVEGQAELAAKPEAARSRPEEERRDELRPASQAVENRRANEAASTRSRDVAAAPTLGQTGPSAAGRELASSAADRLSRRATPVPSPPPPAAAPPDRSQLADRVAAVAEATPPGGPTPSSGAQGRGGQATAQPDTQTATSQLAKNSATSGAVAGRAAESAFRPEGAPSAPAPAAPIVIGVTPAGLTLADDQALAARQMPEAGRRESAATPQVRWRILGGTRVERSSGAGSAWEPVSIASGVVLTGGFAPSPSVCWLIGRGGVVLRAADGIRFERVPFPESADLSLVRAIDARQATVTTADGRVFTTKDAGANWTRTK